MSRNNSIRALLQVWFFCGVGDDMRGGYNQEYLGRAARGLVSSKTLGLNKGWRRKLKPCGFSCLYVTTQSGSQASTHSVSARAGDRRAKLLKAAWFRLHLCDN